MTKLYCTQKEHDILRRLIPHLDISKVALCGGIAIEHHFRQNGITMPRKNNADIDIIAIEKEVVKASVTQDFALWYFNDYTKGDHEDEFYVVPVDKVTGAKIDIFSYKPYTPQDLVEVEFEGTSLKLRSLEDQVVTSVLEYARVLKGKGCDCDPKKGPSIQWMFEVADLSKTESLWNSHPYNHFSWGVYETFERATRHLVEHKDQVMRNFKADPSLPVPAPVSERTDSIQDPRFPLATPEELLELFKRQRNDE